MSTGFLRDTLSECRHKGDTDNIMILLFLWAAWSTSLT